MEKKKLLLVAISVGVFLTIVIGAAILVFSPKSSGASAPGGSVAIGNQFLHGNRAPAETAALTPAEPIAAGTGAHAATEPPVDSLSAPFSIDAADYVRNPEVQGIQPPPAVTATQETYFYINGMQPTDTYRIETVDGGATARVTFNFPQTVTAAVPNPPENGNVGTTHATPPENRPAANPAVPAAQPAAPAKPAAPAAQPAAPAKPAAPAAQPVASAKPAAPAAQPVAPAKPAAPAAQPAGTTKPAAPAKTAEKTTSPAQTKTYTDYWVQTGAFSAKANAEGVKETLSAKGITSIIENRNVNGKTLYQVRVGPYTSENEAKYWLALVQSIDGFSESQIRQTSSVR
jgi:cell division septation protein DedD